MQSVTNQGLANKLFQPFTVIFLVVRSLIVGDLVEKTKEITTVDTYGTSRESGGHNREHKIKNHSRT